MVAVARKKPVVPEIQEYDENDLNECPDCGRQFNPEAYDKHVKICKKVFQKKRKEFNSQAHRVISNEQVQLLNQGKRKEKERGNY